jgi:hypothetical protein
MAVSTALTQLSQQITSTLLEVRSEIGELKCEMKSVRDNARSPLLALSTAAIDLQTQKLVAEFQQELDTKNRELLLGELLSWAASLIHRQKNLIIQEFKSQSLIRDRVNSQLETLIGLAIATIRTQILIVKH